MAKRRTTPELNLQKELPQVLSTDFNLFYKPDVAPTDPSVEAFTKSLDAFVKGAGTDLTILKEVKEKETNEAQAIKDYNENRDKFAKQVENGSIPKEANPYYIEKLQELHLNKKAEDFKIQAYRNYAEAKLNKNTNVGAFDSYYEDQLKNFVRDNQLGTFTPEKLEKGFFSKTSGTRNSLAQTHAQNQLIALGEEFDVLFKENIQSMVVKEKPSLMSAMLEAKEQKGLLSDLEIISLCTQLMVAGNVTTSDLIGNGFYALLNSPGSLELLNQNPELLENAVEEMLRFDCPISETGRIAQEDTLLDNHRIKSHETVTASLSAANHDPEKFSNPHQFRLDRSKNDHIAFGTGIHLCLGAALARLESQLAFKELLTRYPRIRLSHQQPPIRRTLPFFSGFTSLTVQLSE